MIGRSVLWGAVGIAIGAAIGSAFLAKGQGQSTTPFTTGIVVGTCGTAPYGSGRWTYVSGTQAPITINTGGALCVSQ